MCVCMCVCVCIGVYVCGGVCISVRMGVNRKTELEGNLLLEKGSFESTFVLAAAGCNTQNTTRRTHVTGKVKLPSERRNTTEMY